MTRRRFEREDSDAEGVIEDIPLEDARSGTPDAWRDRLFLVMAVVAVGGGLLVAGANAIGLLGKHQVAIRATPTAAASGSAIAAVPTPKPTATPVPVAELWQLTAESHRDNINDVFRYQCPPGGEPSVIYGLGIYAIDSSVCTAAVHWGLFSVADGGTAVIEITAGIDHYPSTVENGIMSFDSFGANASFMFVEGNAQSGPWARGAVVYRGEIGQRHHYDCPPDGSPSPIWGTGLYTDDSSVCTAAVHAGLITFEQGGTVTIKIRPGSEDYRASVQNHVVSGAWAISSGSFMFVRP
ncbi:MAG TPA: LCCL domain-containing protein [Candidatus Limnocylindria bacterium]